MLKTKAQLSPHTGEGGGVNENKKTTEELLQILNEGKYLLKVEYALELIKRGEILSVVENLNNRSHLYREEIVNLIIENIDKFQGLDHKEIVKLIMGDSSFHYDDNAYCIIKNIDKFEGLNKKEIKEIIKKGLLGYQYFFSPSIDVINLLINNRNKFSGIEGINKLVSNACLENLTYKKEIKHNIHNWGESEDWIYSTTDSFIPKMKEIIENKKLKEIDFESVIKESFLQQSHGIEYRGEETTYGVNFEVAHKIQEELGKDIDFTPIIKELFFKLLQEERFLDAEYTIEEFGEGLEFSAEMKKHLLANGGFSVSLIKKYSEIHGKILSYNIKLILRSIL